MKIIADKTIQEAAQTITDLLTSYHANIDKALRGSDNGRVRVSMGIVFTPDGGPKRRYLDNNRTPLQQRIIEASERHPELDKSQIAELVGCRIQHVYRTLKRFALGTLTRPRRELKRREKKSGSYTIRPCLRCGKPHQSEHFGDRLCP